MSDDLLWQAWGVTAAAQADAEAAIAAHIDGLPKPKGVTAPLSARQAIAAWLGDHMLGALEDAGYDIVRRSGFGA